MNQECESVETSIGPLTIPIGAELAKKLWEELKLRNWNRETVGLDLVLFGQKILDEVCDQSRATRKPVAVMDSTSPEFILRKLTFAEKIYQDGSREIVGIEAQCANPQGLPIPYKDGVEIVSRWNPDAAPLREMEYPSNQMLWTGFRHWWLAGFEDEHQTESVVCSYLSRECSRSTEAHESVPLIH